MFIKISCVCYFRCYSSTRNKNHGLQIALYIYIALIYIHSVTCAQLKKKQCFIKHNIKSVTFSSTYKVSSARITFVYEPNEQYILKI